MRIDDAHGEILNTKEVSIHDNYLKQIDFRCETGEIVLLLEKLSIVNNKKIKEQFIIRFTNVIGFDMTTCSFHDNTLRIDEFFYVGSNERKLIPRLQKMRDFTGTNGCCKLDKDNRFLEVVIGFISGDELTVVCEYIDFEYPR